MLTTKKELEAYRDAAGTSALPTQEELRAYRERVATLERETWLDDPATIRGSVLAWAFGVLANGSRIVGQRLVSDPSYVITTERIRERKRALEAELDARLPPRKAKT